MTDLLIATHDQALHAIREHVTQPGVDPLLRAVVIGVIDCHPANPPTKLTPDPDCWGCDGAGWIVSWTDGSREHCHCACPWCAGCDDPLCEGPCETVQAIAEALGLIAPTDLPEGDARG
ncbi:hypothetical protein [Micromonospora tarensis]|uniref:Uncharacterized protein n=1 Tax=Micromonospora tarensis TaxID=2806100 RepID=A0ABS1YCI1_9ACTN|nr:hypothetical protein [Micromonospora tarensis]MBM0275120.1 hypothetical protein [Micromonospora tarensis]